MYFVFYSILPLLLLTFNMFYIKTMSVLPPFWLEEILENARNQSNLLNRRRSWVAADRRETRHQGEGPTRIRWGNVLFSSLRLHSRIKAETCSNTSPVPQLSALDNLTKPHLK